MDRKLWDELHQVYVAIPDEFILVPPDGGDVRSYEAVAKMADEIERLRKALKDKDELVQYLEGHIDGLKKFVVQQKETE